jgi:histidine ammonia-lyase
VTADFFWLGDAPLTLEVVTAVARHGLRVGLSEGSRKRIDRARAVVDRIVALGAEGPAVYGVNTGFGALAEVRISPEQILTLQKNLVRSHAAGVGPLLSTEVVRALMLLRAQVLSGGHSGARAVLCELLLEMLNRRVHPAVPSQGSVGASGDLAPLAHLALVLQGEGEAEHGGQMLPGAEALRRAGLEPQTLLAKEGLTLVNGTQLMTAQGGLALADALRLARAADLVGALTLEALRGTPRPFFPDIHAVRPHPGQIASAKNLHALTLGSANVLAHRDCGKVQDPYSLRCMPQVHGATRDALDYARAVLERETMSATDNPLVFPDDAAPFGGEMVSGGNFHGQPVAMALDFAAIATANLGNISERRIEQLVNPHLSGLPPFLVADSGLNSGYMMAQVTAAALVSENKTHAHPASVDTIPSSAGREDHVSMGPFAARKLAQVVENVERVLAIELLCAVQGLDLRLPVRPAPALAAVHDAVRAVVPHLVQDRPVHVDIAALTTLISTGELLGRAETVLAAKLR